MLLFESVHESVVTGQVNVDGPMAELSATLAVLKLNALPKHCVCHHASVSSDNAHWESLNDTRGHTFLRDNSTIS